MSLLDTYTTIQLTIEHIIINLSFHKLIKLGNHAAKNDDFII